MNMSCVYVLIRTKQKQYIRVQMFVSRTVDKRKMSISRKLSQKCQAKMM